MSVHSKVECVQLWPVDGPAVDGHHLLFTRIKQLTRVCGMFLRCELGPRGNQPQINTRLRSFRSCFPKMAINLRRFAPFRYNTAVDDSFYGDIGQSCVFLFTYFYSRTHVSFANLSMY